MDKIKEIYERIEDDLMELKDIVIDNLYDYYSKNKRLKEYIDDAPTKEIGMRKLLGDSYFYPMIEDKIMILLDPYLSNNESNIKVDTYITTKTPLTLPNQPYKRVSKFDHYMICKNYIDGRYESLNLHDYSDYDYLEDDEDDDKFIIPENFKKITNAISKLDKCRYLGFSTYNDGFYHELYERNDCNILYDFSSTLIDERLSIIRLEIYYELGIDED